MNCFIRCFIALLLTLTAMASEAREVVDQLGRKVTIPNHIQRVYAAAPPLVVLTHMVAPEKLIGLSFAFEPQAARFIPPKIANLPVLGNTIGSGPNMNVEEVMRRKPDVILAWKSAFTDQQRMEESFRRTGIPVLFIKLDTLSDWPAALQFTADVLGRKARGKKLANYVSHALREVDQAVGKLPEQGKLRVYYAEGAEGLATDCNKSFHTEVLELAGAHNVYQCEPKGHYGMEPVSFEQVLQFDPQVIVAQDRNFAVKARHDPRWMALRAVREGHIVSIPRWPHNWFDRPPSAMRALGIQWLAHTLYPARYKKDIRAETRRFYQLFFGVKLSEADLDLLLQPPTQIDSFTPKH